MIDLAQDITPTEQHISLQSLPFGGQVQLGLTVVGFACVVRSPVVLTRLHVSLTLEGRYASNKRAMWRCK